MLPPFLKQVSTYIFNAHKDNIETLCIVLPNKRAGLFLKQHLSKTFGKTIWLPEIISAEEFFTELSGLRLLEEIDLICHLYESYKVCFGKDAENFDGFTKWGQLILQDFNEIDRYLVNSEQLYENLKDIKEIENWSLGAEELSAYQLNYLKFMASLGAIYKHFNAFLKDNHWAYQGLMYKQALNNLNTTHYTKRFNKILFCGFNALNAVELKVISTLYEQGKAEVLWDADVYYTADVNQEAGLFLRRNFERFPKTKEHFLHDNFKEAKDISIVSVPRQMGQAQVVKEKLQGLIDKGITLDKIAVVLANEKLLWPVLQQLPKGIEHVNITMEYPLRYTSAYSLLDSLVQLQVAFSKQKSALKTIYYKDLIKILKEPLFVQFLHALVIDLSPAELIRQIRQRNISFISTKLLQELLGNAYSLLVPYLQPTPSLQDYTSFLCTLLNTLIEFLAKQTSSQYTKLELEYLQIILANYNRLSDLIKKYLHFNDIQSYKQLFSQVIGACSAPFIGEPLKGLQIMGLLESRTLDFEHIILVNANEGILPSGKSINSFIPNDLKRAFGLPLYLEKDAIYAYHFYRLLQRAKEAVIIYDSETDGFGKGEKSRFVTQLQFELKTYNPSIKITEEIADAGGFEEDTQNTIVIQKTEATLERIVQKASSSEKYNSLSPSSLIAFKDCSLRFYFRYGVGLKETEEVEESAEANTFGSILHLSLENIYKDCLNTSLITTQLQAKQGMVEKIVHDSFISFFNKSELQGKSILQEEVINVYVKKMIRQDLEDLEQLHQQKKELHILGLEHEITCSLQVKINTKNTEFFIKGKIDRIDRFEDTIRVIDYKTSVKPTDKFKFTGFETLFSDTQYNKQLQLFLYAWLLYKTKFCAPELLQPCIIAFKDFKSEPRFIQLEKNEPLQFSASLLDEFEQALIGFVETIFANDHPFVQTEDEDLCVYCAYNSICNRTA